MNDLRYAWRGMMRNRAASGVIIASLALGIGANTAIFSLVYPVLLRPLPVERPGELVELLQKYPSDPRGNGWWSTPSLHYYRAQSKTMALTGLGIDNVARVRVEGGAEATAVVEFVADGYFSLLGVKAALGRTIGAGDRDGVAMMSWAVWNSRFGRDPGVLGRQVTINGAAATVIGVAARGFDGLRSDAQTSYWVPAKPDARFALIGRLKDGATIERARAEMESLFRFTIEERASDPQARRLKVEVEPAWAGLNRVRDRVGKPLAALMGIVAVLLLLACANVAGLLLARGASRTREMAVRLGLGASRARLVRQALTESLLLSGIGTAAGAVAAYFATGALLRILESGRPHEQVHLLIRLDVAVLLFACGLAGLTAMLSGLAPALSAIRQSPQDALRQSGGSRGGKFHRRFGGLLAASQVALSMALLGCGGLFLAHLADLKTADLGFARDHILLATLDGSKSRFRGERLANEYRELLEKAGAVPGVRSISLSAPTPVHGAGASAYAAAEGFVERPEDRRRVSIAYVAPRYFETMGIPLRSGRGFERSDESRPRVAVISESMARHYFGGRDAVGRRITLEQITLSREPATFEIAGVAADSNYYEIREDYRRTIYLPAFHGGRVIAGTFVIRSHGDPESVAAGVRRVLEGNTAGMPVASLKSLSEQIDASIVPQRLLAALSGFFAALGALLAGLGLYGLLAYTVARRTAEIGIRLALGATPKGVVRMVGGEGLAIAAAGLAAGVPAALWGRSLVASVFPSAADHASAVFPVGVIVILGVAVAASVGPAARAAGVNPVESLRHE